MYISISGLNNDDIDATHNYVSSLVIRVHVLTIFIFLYNRQYDIT